MSERIDLTARPDTRRTLVAWCIGWSAYALVDASIVSAQSNVPFRYSIVEVIVGHLPFFIATPYIFRIGAQRAKQIALGIAVVLVSKFLDFGLLWCTTSATVFGFVVKKTLLYQFVTATLEYSTLAGIVFVVQSRRRAREAEELAREAELAAARAQLHPHFILNSLNSIVSLIDSDAPRAREMVVRLSQLLHASFRRIDEPLVPLSAEIEMVRAYLDIEQIRFGSRLSVVIDIDENAREVNVPPLILQPIVENAVRHGIAPHPRGGEVRIVASRNARLRLSVLSGAAAPPPPLGSEGTGLSLTRRRLENLYHDNYTLTFGPTPTGFEVTFELPDA